MIHILVRTSSTSPLYRALCGHASDSKKDYIDPTKKSVKLSTCAACVEKVGRVAEPITEWRLK